MAGWSRIRLFDPSGLWIDEIDVPTKRSWVLDGVGRCQFTMPIYDAESGGKNPKLTYNNFKYGNFVVIDHKPSVNADGTQNGLLPPWVGIILPPQNWNYGKVDFTAFSAEQVLKYRPIGNNFYTGRPGSVFSQVLAFANRWGGIPIQPGTIDLSGQNMPYMFSADALSQVIAYSKYTGYDWDITPSFGNQNRLVLLGNWYKKKGIDSGQVINNLNLQNTSPLYTEQGEFYNLVYGNNDGTNDSLVTATAQDQTSVSQHGVLGLKQVFSGTVGVAPSVIGTMTAAYLANLANNPTFTRTFAPTVLDVDNAFSFCVTDNTWLIQNDTVGFFNGGIGINGSIRITAVEYSELTNSARMAGIVQ